VTEFPVDRAGYRLKLDPDKRPWTARENLVDILERELLGPANGPEEILNGVPDPAYLSGRIAPVRLQAGRSGRPLPRRNSRHGCATGTRWICSSPSGVISSRIRRATTTVIQ
jgi:hypothetical protein